ncbi:phenolic acid decarboxylase [Salinisphaera shabanensis T35B1]|uniref:phenolic acid decarboxylase n=1 Tax=Salinisphaera shabanensis TaxID=180542 RepID=UPI0033422904
MITEESFESTHPDTLTAFVGRHFIYTYDNGWQYEMYIKNARTIDYRIHSGMVGGRWVRDQAVHLPRLSDDVCKVSWNEPTGTSVSVAVNFAERHLHGVIFFPRWVADAPEKTVCYQNDHLDTMLAYRDAGPTYPTLVIDEFATVTFLERCEVDDESVVAEAPDQLPVGYADRRN